MSDFVIRPAENRWYDILKTELEERHGGRASFESLYNRPDGYYEDRYGRSLGPSGRGLRKAAEKGVKHGVIKRPEQGVVELITEGDSGE